MLRRLCLQVVLPRATSKGKPAAKPILPESILMVNLFSIIALGFLFGMRHATDADHVVAVTTIVARHRSSRHAAVIGAFWGLGHTLTILAVGGGIILLGWVIPARIGLSMEFSVGLMLILLGVLNLTGILQWLRQAVSPGHVSPEQIQTQTRSHGEYVHTHPHEYVRETHSHSLEQVPLGWLDRNFGRIGIYQLLRPLFVGIVHGLAGSAAVALMVLTTIRNTKWAVVYLIDFGIGTMVGMMLMTVAIAVPFAYSGKQSSQLNWGLRIASGLISLGFGFFIVYKIGFVNGLFSGDPQWSPR